MPSNGRKWTLESLRRGIVHKQHGYLIVERGPDFVGTVTVVPESDLLAAERERDEARLWKPERDLFMQGEQEERTRALAAEQSLREAEGWASVGRSGMCVHSKTVEGCAGCEVRNLRQSLREVREALEEALAYVPDHFIKKHDMDAVLGRLSTPKEEASDVDG